MIRMACVGDNVVDINYMDRKINPGGNCVNVAAYGAQMGHTCAYIGVLADDHFADVLTDSFKKLGILYDKSPVLHGETGRCFIQLVDGDRVIGDENDGGLVKSDPLKITSEIVDYLKGFDVIHTSVYSYLDDQLPCLKSTGVPVLYDFSTNWSEEKFAEVCPYIDFMLLSKKDGISTVDSLEMMKKAAAAYGVQIAVLTCGTEGANVWDGKTLYQKEPYNVAGGAVDTTGCGDSWIAGFITTYIEGMVRIETMIKTSQGNFITEENVADYKKNLIEMSMCMGNAKARYTSQIKGGYGYGQTFDEFGLKK